MTSESKLDSATLSAHEARIAQLRAASPNILFFIARSKNLNLVVYEALVDSKSGNLSVDKPVDVYWQDIDPEYMKKNRASGVKSDRSDLNYIEKTMAYGLSSSPADGKPSGYYSVKLVSFPDRLVTVWKDSTSGKCRAQIAINGKQCDLKRIYVETKDSWTGPKVQFVDLTGTDENGANVFERYTPK